MLKGILIAALLVVCGVARAFDAAPLLPWVTAPTATPFSPFDLSPYIYMPLDGSPTNVIGTTTAEWVYGTPAYTNGPWAGVRAASFSESWITAGYSSGSLMVATGGVAWTVAFWSRSDYKAAFCPLGYVNGQAPANRIFSVLNNRPVAGTGTPNINVRATGNLTGLGLDDGAWHHYAVTWDGSACTFYLDGAYHSTLSVGSLMPTAPALCIGNMVVSSLFPAAGQGHVAQVLLYDFALGSGDVGKIYDWRGGTD